jgi:hypothetical protein
MLKFATFALCAAALTFTACDEEELSIHDPASELDEFEEFDALDFSDEIVDATEESESLPEDAAEARAKPCAYLYQHRDYRGDRKRVERGARTRYIGDLWNDEVSSIKVRSGCVLNVYEHKGFRGAQKSFRGLVPYVGNWWNDRISSYTCSC